MNRTALPHRLLRLLSLVLIPCLIVDPVTAAAMARPHRVLLGSAEYFQSQAIPTARVFYPHPEYASSSVRVLHNFIPWIRGLADVRVVTTPEGLLAPMRMDNPLPEGGQGSRSLTFFSKENVIRFIRNNRLEVGFHTHTGGRAFQEVPDGLLAQGVELAAHRVMVPAVDRLDVLDLFRQNPANDPFPIAFLLEGQSNLAMSAAKRGANILILPDATTEFIQQIRLEYPDIVLIAELSHERATPEELETVTRAGIDGVLLKKYTDWDRTFSGGPLAIPAIHQQFPHLLIIGAGGIRETTAAQVLERPESIIAAVGVNQTELTALERQLNDYAAVAAPYRFLDYTAAPDINAQDDALNPEFVISMMRHELITPVASLKKWLETFSKRHSGDVRSNAELLINGPLKSVSERINEVRREIKKSDPKAGLTPALKQAIAQFALSLQDPQIPEILDRVIRNDTSGSPSEEKARSYILSAYHKLMLSGMRLRSFEKYLEDHGFSGHPAWINPQESIQKVLSVLDPDGTQLSVRMDDDVVGSVFKADPDHLVGVWVNVIENALHADAKKVHFRIRKVSDEVVIEVTDNGSGIHPEVVPHIFEKGYSQRSSTGLGLAIANRVVHEARGHIEVSSVLGTGTTFRLDFPAAAPDRRYVTGLRVYQDASPDPHKQELLDRLDQVGSVRPGSHPLTGRPLPWTTRLMGSIYYVFEEVLIFDGGVLFGLFSGYFIRWMAGNVPILDYFAYGTLGLSLTAPFAVNAFARWKGLNLDRRMVWRLAIFTLSLSIGLIFSWSPRFDDPSGVSWLPQLPVAVASAGAMLGFGPAWRKPRISEFNSPYPSRQFMESDIDETDLVVRDPLQTPIALGMNHRFMSGAKSRGGRDGAAQYRRGILAEKEVEVRRRIDEDLRGFRGTTSESAAERIQHKAIDHTRRVMKRENDPPKKGSGSKLVLLLLPWLIPVGVLAGTWVLSYLFSADSSGLFAAAWPGLFGTGGPRKRRGLRIARDYVEKWLALLDDTDRRDREAIRTTLNALRADLDKIWSDHKRRIDTARAARRVLDQEREKLKTLQVPNRLWNRPPEEIQAFLVQRDAEIQASKRQLENKRVARQALKEVKILLIHENGLAMKWVNSSLEAIRQKIASRTTERPTPFFPLLGSTVPGQAPLDPRKRCARPGNVWRTFSSSKIRCPTARME